MYAVYCNNYDNAEQLLLKLLKRRKDFETAVNVRVLLLYCIKMCLCLLLVVTELSQQPAYHERAAC